jgi:hypothetical protein
VDTADARSHLSTPFAGSFCGVPTIVTQSLIERVPANHSVTALDIANAAKPVEVSRTKFGETCEPHWTGWARIVSDWS